MGVTVLLVWLITEEVTDDPKSACVSVCSLPRTEGEDSENKQKTKLLLHLCEVLCYIQRLFECV